MKSEMMKTIHLSFVGAFSVLVISFLTVPCMSGTFKEEKSNDHSRRVLSLVEEFPWLGESFSSDDDDDDDEDVLSRDRRSTNETIETVWEEIEEFYSDKNNMAMYCVLPILILVYGGCSSIYCIYKCRQYLRRRKHKRLKEDCDSLHSEKNDLNQGKKGVNNGPKDPNKPISQISQAWTNLHLDPTENRWSGQTEGAPLNSSSPLPWQVPDKATAATVLAMSSRGDRMTPSRASYLDDKLNNEHIQLQGGLLARGKQPAVKDSSLDDKNAVETGNGAAAAAAVSDPLRRPAQVKAADPQTFEETRTHANLTDYATNRSSAVKATDYSRFSNSQPIEIIPLSADPNLRVWDPLHKRPFGESAPFGNWGKLSAPGAQGGPAPAPVKESIKLMKEEMLERYDAISTFQMTKKAAEILKTNAEEKSPFQRKPTKKKQIFIAE